MARPRQPAQRTPPLHNGKEPQAAPKVAAPPVTLKHMDNIAENLEQSQETIEKAHVVRRSDLTQVHKLAAELIAELERVPDGDMVGEIISNALKLLRDQT